VRRHILSLRDEAGRSDQKVLEQLLVDTGDLEGATGDAE